MHGWIFKNFLIFFVLTIYCTNNSMGRSFSGLSLYSGTSKDQDKVANIFSGFGLNNDVLRSSYSVHTEEKITTICWNEITTLHFYKNGTTYGYIEYSISMEEAQSEPISQIEGDPKESYAIYDDLREQPRILDFLTIDNNNEELLKENITFLCKSATAYAKIFTEFPTKNRIEIKLKPISRDVKVSFNYVPRVLKGESEKVEEGVTASGSDASSSGVTEKDSVTSLLITHATSQEGQAGVRSSQSEQKFRAGIIQGEGESITGEDDVKTSFQDQNIDADDQSLNTASWEYANENSEPVSGDAFRKMDEPSAVGVSGDSTFKSVASVQQRIADANGSAVSDSTMQSEASIEQRIADENVPASDDSTVQSETSIEQRIANASASDDSSEQRIVDVPVPGDSTLQAEVHGEQRVIDFGIPVSGDSSGAFQDGGFASYQQPTSLVSSIEKNNELELRIASESPSKEDRQSGENNPSETVSERKLENSYKANSIKCSNNGKVVVNIKMDITDDAGKIQDMEKNIEIDLNNPYENVQRFGNFDQELGSLIRDYFSDVLYQHKLCQETDEAKMRSFQDSFEANPIFYPAQLNQYYPSSSGNLYEVPRILSPEDNSAAERPSLFRILSAKISDGLKTAYRKLHDG